MTVFEKPLPTDNRGNVEVVLQDQFTTPVDLYLVNVLDTLTILSNTALLSDTIDIETTGATPVAGNMVCLKEGFRFYQGVILTVTPIAGNQYTLTLDSPLDFAYTTAGGCSLTTKEMNVNGSVAPVTFSVTPGGLDDSMEWDILTMSFYIQGTAAMDDGDFGDQAAIAKGVLVRGKNGPNYKNIFNFKTNGDLHLDTGNRNYADDPPDTKTSVSAQKHGRDNQGHGVTARLKASTVDEFQVVIQDNLLAVDDMHIKIFGHVVE